jgi:hypothetical protein
MSADETREQVNQIARVLIAEWERVEGPVTASYVANFADMARALLASGLIPEATTTVEWGVRVTADDPDYRPRDVWLKSRSDAEPVIRRASSTRKLIRRTRMSRPDQVTDWTEVKP